MRTILISTALLLVLGCATHGGSSGPEPDAAIIQLSRAPEGTQYDTGPLTNAIPTEITPHVIMIRAIHTRTPKRSSSRLLGISKSTYDTKKTPAPNPYTVGEKCSAAFI